MSDAANVQNLANKISAIDALICRISYYYKIWQPKNFRYTWDNVKLVIVAKSNISLFEEYLKGEFWQKNQLDNFA